MTIPSSGVQSQILFMWLQRLPADVRSLMLVAIYVVAGLALDKVASLFATSEGVNAWYPPAGLHIVLLLRFGLRYIPELLFVPLIAKLVVTPQPIAPSYVLIYALCIMVGYGGACALLLHQLQVDPCLRRFRDAIGFIIVVIGASLIVALGCVTTLALAGGLAWPKWGLRVLHFWAGDATGIAMLAPPLLLLSCHPERETDSRIDRLVRNQPWPKVGEVLEWIAELVALVAISCAAYGIPATKNLNYTYFIFLPIVWIAMRHGFKRATVAVLLLNLSVAIWVRAMFGNSHALALQFGLMTVSYGGLLVGAAVTQQKLLQRIADQAAISLHNAQSCERLEELVIERTRELQEEKLLSEAANRAKTDFLANMSHELRSPLTSVLGFSKVLLQQIFGPLNEKQHQYIATIRSSGEHLLELINDLLDLSKVEAGREDLALETLSVEEVCQSCLSLMQERAHNHGLQLSLSIAPEVKTCVADKRRLKQILVNLLSNAVKFTEAGSVTLRVTASADTIHFAVIDTGIGIAETERAALFQPFRQLDGSLNRQDRGTGLGLALSQRLAQLHGGNITVESELGRGSCFTLDLPQPPPVPPMD